MVPRLPLSCPFYLLFIRTVCGVTCGALWLLEPSLLPAWMAPSLTTILRLFIPEVWSAHPSAQGHGNQAACPPSLGIVLTRLGGGSSTKHPGMISEAGAAGRSESCTGFKNNAKSKCKKVHADVELMNSITWRQH